MEPGHRVRVKPNGRTGTIARVWNPGPPRRYLVMYDEPPGPVQPLGDTTPPESGQDWAEDELELL